MSLATRLSASFLAALGVVLAVFSISIHAAARSDLGRQLDGRLEAALDTLEAAVDIEPGGLEWEPDDRRITLGVDPGIDQVRWIVLDGRGEPIDRSSNAGGGDFPPSDPAGLLAEVAGDASSFASAEGWRLAGRRLRLEELLRAGRGHPEDDLPDDDVEFDRLILIAGLSPAPTRAILDRLSLWLAGLSAATWIGCAGLGHLLARRALAPIAQMAHAARSLDPGDPGWSLPGPGTGDELDVLATAYNQLLGRLREAYEHQRRFAGDASHQLRTPLAGLIGQAEFALRRERSADEYRRVLGIVRDEARRLGRIVEAMLFLVRPDGDAARPGVIPIDLAAWLPEQLRRWASLPRGGEIWCESDGGPVEPVLADPVLLAQCLDNLLDNALKYSEPGSGVRVGLGREGDAVLLRVTDAGCGLDAEDRARIFEPFYRSAQARRRGRPGEGLGLAVARRIAERLGGGLDVRSEPGRGSQFRVRLPMAPPQPAARGPSGGAARDGPDRPAPSTGEGAGPRPISDADGRAGRWAGSGP